MSDIEDFKQMLAKMDAELTAKLKPVRNVQQFIAEANAETARIDAEASARITEIYRTLAQEDLDFAAHVDEMAATARKEEAAELRQNEIWAEEDRKAGRK